MILANEALLAICHLISIVCSWSNCLIKIYHSFNAALWKLTLSCIFHSSVHDLHREAWKPAGYLRT